MDLIKTVKKKNLEIGIDRTCSKSIALEVAVVEDNRLVNLILSSELFSTITRLKNERNCNINFSRFYSGKDFLSYLENKNDQGLRYIIFSDFYLENNMNGVKILKQLKKREINATVIITSDTTNRQISIDAMKMGAFRFVPKDDSTPIVCSEILYQLVI